MIEEGKVEEPKIWEGVVSEDGQEIDFKSDTPMWCGQGIKNDLYLLRINVKVSAYLLIGIFWFFSLISLYGYLAGNVSAFPAASLIPFSFSLTLGAFIFFRGTSGHPKAIAMKKEGIVVFYGNNKSYVISWGSIRDVKEKPSTAPESKTFSLVWSKNGITIKHTDITPMIAELVFNSMARRGEVMFYFDVNSPSFGAWYTAPPRSKVFVTEKLLSDDELRYRKLRRRFLDNGMFTPVYVSEEEDVHIVKEFINSKSLPLEELKKIGNLALEQALWKEAAEIWHMIYSIAPDDREVMLNLAGSLIKSHDFDEGLKIINKILKKDPKSSHARFLQSIAFYEQGKVDEASHTLGMAVEADPNNIEALQLWFDIVTNETGLAQAIAEIDYLASTHNKAWGPLYIIGLAYEKGQKWGEAHRYYQKALSRECNEHTIGAMSSVFINMGKPNEVLSLFKEHSSNLPPNSPIFLAQVHAWLMQGQTGEAQTLLKTLEQVKDIRLLHSIQELRQQFGLSQ